MTTAQETIWTMPLFLGREEDRTRAEELGLPQVPALNNDGSRTIMGPAGPVAYVLPTTNVKRGQGHTHIDAERDAWGHLIAAAPELLAACKALVAAFDGDTDCTDILDMIGDPKSALRAAIAKAEGKDAAR